MNIYIHIPFCASKCSYCHFYYIANSSLIDQYVGALIREIKLRLPLRAKAESIYFGGGTPSLLKPSQIQTILHQLPSSKTCEISIECHPNTLTTTKIRNFLSLGINRLSIGIQSWNEDILSSMNRHYDPSNLITCIKYSKSIGLNNINLDHIIAYPGQSDDTLNKDIRTSLSLSPTHISIYPLEKHPHTRIKTSPSATKIVRQFKIIQTTLVKSGYRHYEELNFALPGFECRHNLDFWLGKDYLGLGASATSRLSTHLSTNSSSVLEYISTLTANKLPPSSKSTLTSNQNHRLDKDLNSRLL